MVRQSDGWVAAGAKEVRRENDTAASDKQSNNGRSRFNQFQGAGVVFQPYNESGSPWLLGLLGMFERAYLSTISSEMGFPETIRLSALDPLILLTVRSTYLTASD